jgi:hypothetical protein
MMCRNDKDDIETRVRILSWDEPGGYLITGQAVSGMKVAPAWLGLLYGTWNLSLVERTARSRMRSGAAANLACREGASQSAETGRDPSTGSGAQGRTVPW